MNLKSFCTAPSFTEGAERIIMNCTNHPDKEALGVCGECGKPFCADCLYEADGKYYCDDHGPYGRNRHSKPEKVKNAPEPPVKCYSIFVGLALIAGLTGAHFFYIGKTASGVTMLFLSVLCAIFGSFVGGIGYLGLIILQIVAFIQACIIKNDGYNRPMV